MAMHHVLVVDDDPGLRELLAEYLGSRGFAVRTAVDGPSGLEAAQSSDLDVVILDVMLPGLDGIGVLRELRAVSQVPVVMLTARGDDVDRIVGLELGADDYLPKPFNPRELVARLEAVLRRVRAEPGGVALRAGPLVVDPDRRTATVDGQLVELTTTEFEILRVLVERAGRVVPRDKLMELARGEDFASFERSVDVHVSHLRRKLGDESRAPRFIKTVRGVGYTIPREPG